MTMPGIKAKRKQLVRKTLKLSPKECEVMICLYIDRLSIADTATKLKIKPDTVSTHKHNAINKIRKAMGEH